MADLLDSIRRAAIYAARPRDAVLTVSVLPTGIDLRATIGIHHRIRLVPFEEIERFEHSSFLTNILQRQLELLTDEVFARAALKARRGEGK